MSKGKEAIPQEIVAAESAALLALWNAAKKAKSVPSQKAFGEQFGIGTQGAVWQYLNGERPLNIKAARAFADVLNEPIAKFSPRLAMEVDKTVPFATAPDDDEFLPIQQVSGFVFGGNGGHTPNYEEVIGQLRFRTDFLRECGVTPQNGRIIKVRGNSMFPRIPDGSVVLVKLNEKDPVPGGIFAIAHPSFGPIIKRLELRDKVWIAESENPDHPPIAIEDANAVIIGRAVWMGTTL